MGTIVDAPRYGTGNSKFYAQSDMASHQTIKRLPSVRRLNELDQTLYLSNSTFFNDQIQNPEIRPPPSGSSFRHHGYSPTDPTRKSSLPSPILPPVDYDLTDGIDGAHDISNFIDSSVAPADTSAMNKSGLPPGTAAVFSPGRTIIHRIVRQNSTSDYPVSSPPPMSVPRTEPADLGIPLRLTYSAPPLSHQYHTANTTTGYNSGNASAGINPTIIPSSNNNTNSSNSSSNNIISNTNNNNNDIGRIATPFVQLQAKPCRTKGCMFYGSANTNFYCSKCCQINLNPQKSQSKILTDV